jgi:RHS repeat-associated protein
MQMLIDNNNTSIYVIDWKPFEETRYRARFYFDPNSITMASGNAHYLFYALNRDDVVVARVELQYASSSYQVRAAAVNDGSTWSTTAWTTISDAPHYLGIDWKASSASGANNGSLTFWVDGVQKGSFTTIDNDTRRVDKVHLGAVAGIDTGTRGTYYFDAFESRRQTYIGQASRLGPGSAEIAEHGGKKVLAAPRSMAVTPSLATNSSPETSSAANLPAISLPDLPVFTPLPTTPAMPLFVQGQAVTTTITYTYDPLYRLTQASYNDGTYFKYTYDAVGNRLTEETAWVTVNSYVYDPANRLVSMDGIPYTWDNNGNLLSDGIYTYAYDHANRLTAVSGLLSTVSYRYNGTGDRLQQTVNSVTTSYTLDLAAGLTQVLANGTQTYLYGVGRVAQYRLEGVDYFLGDALGSVRQLVDGNGAVTLAKSYQPYGEVYSSTGSGASNYGFTNEYTSQGLIYLRARWYAPKSGRFVNKDTWGGEVTIPMSYNAWLYVYGNPASQTDPTGWYGGDVHKQLTREQVARWVNVIPLPALKMSGNNLADVLAEWNYHVDRAKILWPLPNGCTPCHFMSWESTEAHVNEAMETAIAENKIYLFGAALHQLQDYYSHWSEGYHDQVLGHGFNSIRSKARTINDLKDFYLGGHYQLGNHWFQSPFPAHPREDIIRDLQNRNPGINLMGLSDWDLVDLYLRLDHVERDQQALRDYFGFDTDLYVPGSYRDNLMEFSSYAYVTTFMLKLAVAKECSIELSPPLFTLWDYRDDEIKAFLLK